MTSILIPVDFSKTAAKALSFAVGLSEKLGAKLEVVYFWHPNFDSNSQKVLSAESEIQQRHQKRMDDFLEEQHLSKDIGQVRIGFPS